MKIILLLPLIVMYTLLIACTGQSDGSADTSGISSSSSVPSNNEPLILLLESEDYQRFFDNDVNNSGNAYRSDAVDISEYQPGLYAVSHLKKGEWLEYDAALPRDSNYELTLRYTSMQAEFAYSVLVNGHQIGGRKWLPRTSSGRPWAEQTIVLGNITASPVSLRVVVLESLNNNVMIDWLKLSTSTTEVPPVISTLAKVFEEGDASAGASQYSSQCLVCHGDRGQGVPNVGPALINCPTCDSFQGLANYIADYMPTQGASNCTGSCAANISAYVRSEFNPDQTAEINCRIDNVQTESASVLKRLSKREYVSTMSDLLKARDIDFSAVPEEFSVDNLDTIGSAQVVSENQLRAYLDIAKQQADVLSSDGAMQSRLIPCAITSAGCLEKFVSEFAYLAFRRPLSEKEIQRIVEFSNDNTSTSTPDSFARALHVILTSPRFLYRVELGGNWSRCASENNSCRFSGTQRVRFGDGDRWQEMLMTDSVDCNVSTFGDPSPGETKYCEVSPVTGSLTLSSYELVSRLSFALWGRSPNKEMLDRASNDELNSRESIRGLLITMLEHNHAKVHMSDFFRRWLGVNLLVEPGVTPDRWYTGIMDDFWNETSNLLDEYAWSDKNFLEIFTANHSYLTPELAQFYRVEHGPTGRTEFGAGDPRRNSGLLSHAANMMAKTDGDLVAVRGEWVRSTFLCRHLDIPSSVQDDLDGRFAGVSPLDIIGIRNQQAGCAGCHVKIDPIGVALINFNQYGFFDHDVNPLRYPISPSLPDINPHTSATLQTLASDLSQFERVGECLAERIFFYTRFRAATELDQCVIKNATEAFVDSGYDFTDLLLALLESPSFHERMAPQTITSVE